MQKKKCFLYRSGVNVNVYGALHAGVVIFGAVCWLCGWSSLAGTSLKPLRELSVMVCGMLSSLLSSGTRTRR